MKNINSYLIVGIVLLLAGLIVLNFAGHKHMSKGFILSFVGFILSGSSTLFLIQMRIRRNKTKGYDKNS